MINRIKISLLAILLVLDMLIQVIIKVPIYIITGKLKPDPRESISAWIGNSALRGHLVARVLEKVIDGVLGKGHCASAAGLDTMLDKYDDRAPLG